ncbi:MAG: hypothetical protein HY231_25530 [Acidobacteria bacterium]|nr:hypothetical protein [Acidobacteriota bacterium]
MKILFNLPAKFMLFLLLSSIAVAQQATPQRRITPRLTTEDVMTGKSGSLTAEDKTEAFVPPNQPENSRGESFNALSLVKNSFSKLAALSSLRFKLKINGAPQGDLEMVIETAKPNRYHIQSQTGEAIIIGSTLYSREGKGAWKIVNSPLPKPEFDPQQILNAMSSTPNLKLQGRMLGKASIDNVPTILYEITEIKAGNAGNDSVLLWIGEEDQIPRKMKVSKSSPSMEVTMWYSDFNSVAINPPN